VCRSSQIAVTNSNVHSFFHEAIRHLEQILEIKPDIIAYDLHPDYFSTKWALQQSGAQLVAVQHHHAHIASCMAENHLEGRVIGFALDGTGYSTDGHIWGGEVLIAGYEGFERAAHFDYVPLPGGGAAIREPWRMAISYLAHHFGRRFLELDIPFVRQLNRPKVDFLLRMMEQGVNSPLTSSCGRLFDAVAALVGIRQQVNYEAQAAIELEMAIASSADETGYPLDLVQDGDSWIINTRPLFEALLADLSQNLPVPTISRRFHNGLVEGFVQLVKILRKKTALDRVVRRRIRSVHAERSAIRRWRFEPGTGTNRGGKGTGVVQLWRPGVPARLDGRDARPPITQRRM
jgi:hydrogenase maturation protein HypF